MPRNKIVTVGTNGPKRDRVGDVKTFQNFVVPIPASIDPGEYSAVIVWCETFSQFITAARYQ